MALEELFPQLRVANVVKRDKEGNYELKSFDDVFELILDFAPEANRDKISDKRKITPYDVFISTDAYGAGVNLQDASVVISYDLAWTPDVIIQRAGRILRLWSKPRQVFLFAFIAGFESDIHRQRESQKVEDRLRVLTARTSHAERFTELPMMPETDRVAYTTLSGLSNVTIEYLGQIDITEIEEFSGVSRYLQHITELNHNMDLVKTIPDDITSALAFDGASPLLYLLLRYQETYIWTLLDIATNQFLDIKEDALLNMLQCSKDEPVGNANPDVIEEKAQVAKALWCEINEIEYPDRVERIAVLYLLPRSEHDDSNRLLG